MKTTTQGISQDGDKWQNRISDMLWEFRFPRKCSRGGWDINKRYRMGMGLVIQKGQWTEEVVSKDEGAM